MSRNRKISSNRQGPMCFEFTDKFVQIIEDSKKRDEDIFTNFLDFVSASDKRNASKLMEGFGNIVKDIRKMKVYFYLK